MSNVFTSDHENKEPMRALSLLITTAKNLTDLTKMKSLSKLPELV